MSDPDARAKREPPERTGPRRNPLMPPPKVNGAAYQNGEFAGSRPEQHSGDIPKDALECGVRIAYTVIDEYLRRGYKAAQDSKIQRTEEGNMFDNRNYYSGGNNPWGWGGAPMLPWMSMMRAWTEMLCAFTPGCMPQPPQGMWNPGCYSAGSAPLPPVSLSVETTRIVVATASINPAAECLNLKIDGLRNNGNRIERVSIHS